jgi:hypothetical protein
MNRRDIGRPEISLAGVNCRGWTVAEDVSWMEGMEESGAAGALSS